MSATIREVEVEDPSIGEESIAESVAESATDEEESVAEAEEPSVEEGEEKRSKPPKKPKKVKISKKVYRLLLPRVTHYRKKPLQKMQTDLALERIPAYLKGYYIDTDEPTPLVFKRFGKEYRYPPEYIQAQLSVLSPKKLKATLAYLLTHDLITQRSNFVNFYHANHPEEAEVFLHELFKEPPHIQEAAYQISNNLKSYYANIRKEKDEFTGKSKTVSTNTKEYDYQRPTGLPPYEPLSETYYLDVEDNGYKILLIDAGPGSDGKQPHNPFAKLHVRTVTGLADGTDDRVVRLCGMEVQRFLERAANETERHPELSAYAERGNKLRENVRRLCPVDEEKIQRFLPLLKSDYDPAQPIKLRREHMDDLIRYGNAWSDERIRQAYDIAEEE